MYDTGQDRPPRFPMALTSALEHAAGTIARLDAIRGQVAIDGKAIDALAPGGTDRGRSASPTLIDRGIPSHSGGGFERSALEPGQAAHAGRFAVWYPGIEPPPHW
jgi:hypothetical protein